MNKDKYFASVKENLEELDTRAAILNEQRAILISDSAKLIISELSHETVEYIYKEFLDTFDSPSVSDKLIFTRSLVSHFGEAATIRHLLSSSNNELPIAGAHSKISYVRNRYNDEAYSVFSSVIPHAKPIFCQSFEDCCEAIASGECEFAIIPLEDSVNGKMFGFYSLLDRYELKIAFVCSVEREDSSQIVRYALVCRYFHIDKLEKRRSEPQRIFEFTITHTPSSQLSDIYRAAELSYAKEYRATSLSLPYGDNMARFYHSFIVTKETHFLPFLLYLSLEYPEYTPIGIYREI